MRITSKFTTVATVGYLCSVNIHKENRAAHGGVCHLQARKAADGSIVGRYVNTNGRQQEVGPPFIVDAEMLASWERIEKSAR